MKAKGISTVALIFCLAVGVRGENARLPYGALYRMETIQQQLAHTFTNLVVVLRIIPTNAAVKAEDVQAYIDAKSGRDPVKLGKDGAFNVPLSDDLLAEQVWLVTNQPRGAMQLDWGLALAVDRVANPTSYRRLMKTVQDCEVVQNRMREVLPTAAPANVTGIRFVFAATAVNASAVIHGKAGDQKIGTDAKGGLVIPMNAAWLEEDPQVTFSETPESQELAGQ